jgi:polysaccharide export outer membrane protein
MFQNPQVVVIVEEYNNNYVYILGRVGNPGKHVFDSKPSLLELITLAQGVQSVNPSTSANAGLVNYTESYEKAIIFRGKDQIIEVDLDKLLRDGNMKLNIPLHTRDIVFVPKTDKRIYILGEIETPGMYPYERDMTLLQAVSIAGNSNTNSNLKRVRVIRGDPANPTLLHRNVASALNGSRYVPLKLQPGDIVYVPKKGSEKFKFTVQWINTAIGTILTGDSLVKLIEGR